MTFSGLRRWVGLGVLTSAALLGAACGPVPDMGGNDVNRPPENFFGGVRATPEQVRATQLSTNRGYNGTIQDIGSSIDPRTPDKEGTPGRSLPVDLAWQRMGQGGQQGMGGSGSPATYGELDPTLENREPPSGATPYLDKLEKGEGAGPGGAAGGNLR